MIKYLWTTTEQAEFEALKNNRKLYTGSHETYFVLPSGEERRYEYVTVNWLGDLLTQTWKRFIFRKFPKMVVDGDEAIKQLVKNYISSLNLKPLCATISQQLSYAGFGVFKFYYSQLTKKVCITPWAMNDNEFITFEYYNDDYSMPVAVNFWYYKLIPTPQESTYQTATTTINDATAVMVQERHELLFNSAGEPIQISITNNAWKTNNLKPQNDEYSWGQLWSQDAIVPEQNEVIDISQLPLNLRQLPVVIVKNIDIDGDNDGNSDYTSSLVSIQKNINKLVAVRQLVIDLSESPMMEVPPEFLDENDQVDWNKVRLRISYEGEKTSAQIKVTQWTGNLENSEKQWVFYENEFYKLTGISPATGTLDSQARSGLARRYGMIATEAEITFRRQVWEQAFLQIFKVAYMLDVAVGGKSLPTMTDLNLNVNWPTALPNETGETSNILVAEKAAGIRSLESCVEQSPLNEDATDEWIQEEIKRLELERERNLVDDLPLESPKGVASGQAPISKPTN